MIMMMIKIKKRLMSIIFEKKKIRSFYYGQKARTYKPA